MKLSTVDRKKFRVRKKLKNFDKFLDKKFGKVYSK